MDAEGSLREKPREACITEDIGSIDLGWFENTKLNPEKNGTLCVVQVGIRDWESLGASPPMIQKGFCETVAVVMDAELEFEEEKITLQRGSEWRKQVSECWFLHHHMRWSRFDWRSVFHLMPRGP